MASSEVARQPGLARLRPGVVAEVTQRLLPVLVGLSTPVVTYLLMRHQSPLVVVGAAIALPLLAMLRPAAVALLLIPLCVLGPLVHRGSQAMLGAAAVLAAGIILHVACGFAPLRRSHVAIALFGVAVLVSYRFPAVLLPSQESRLFNVMGLLIGLALLAATVAVPASARHIAAVTAVTGALVAAYVLVNGGDLHGRLQGLHLNPNYLGAVVALPLVASVGLAITTKKPLWLLPALPAVTALLATKSRGALIAAAAGMLLLFARRGWHKQPLVIFAVLLTGLAILAGSVDTGSLPLGRSSSELQYNNEVRADTAKFALHVALGHPLRGIGYDMYAPFADGPNGIGLYINTHNDYLRLFAECGIVTLLLFLALLWLGVRGRPNPDLAVLRAVVACYAVGLLFANTLANLVVSAPFWVALGCLMAHQTWRRRRTAGATPGREAEEQRA